jgi:hypothetical protein
LLWDFLFINSIQKASHANVLGDESRVAVVVALLDFELRCKVVFSRSLIRFVFEHTSMLMTSSIVSNSRCAARLPKLLLVSGLG